MNAICLVIDRLHAGYLGCYGNTWVATPGLNRLASEAFVFDQALVDTPSLTELYGSYWWGLHALERSGGRSLGRPSLARLLSQAGIATALCSDDPLVAEHPAAGDFGQLIQLDAPAANSTADQLDRCHLAGYFAAATDWLKSARRPFFLWLHTQGLAAPWDAPLDFRDQYADPDEPLPPRRVEVPHRLLSDQYDPDEVWGVCQAYAGQVSLVDLCVGGLVEFLRRSSLAEETLLVLLAARGFPLGEHRYLGCWDDVLHTELVHIPWLVRFPDGLGAAARSQALVQPPDLAATLLDWWGIEQPAPSGVGRSLLPVIRDEVELVRDRACIKAAGGERAIRVAAWYLRLADQAPGERAPRSETSRHAQLYAKPDDYWEVNDVADRCSDVAEALCRALGDFETAAQTGSAASLAPLEEILGSGIP